MGNTNLTIDSICELTNNALCPDVNLHSVGVVIEEINNLFTVYFIGKDSIVEGLYFNHLDIINVEKTGDEQERKICDRCFEIKFTRIEFENNRIKKGGKITKRPSCRDCRKIKNGLNIPIKHKTEWMKKKPKLGEIFTCPICTKKSLGGVSKHVLDHNHHTGQIRGFLCESCNTGIGRFDDNVELVKNAINWLNRKSDF